jgi:hypothetical protein
LRRAGKSEDLDGLSEPPARAVGDPQAFGIGARRLIQGADQVITLREFEGHERVTTEPARNTDLPPAEAPTGEERGQLKLAGILVSTCAAPASNQYSIQVSGEVSGTKGEPLLLSITERTRSSTIRQGCPASSRRV